MAIEEKRSTANLVVRVSANTADRIIILSDPTANAQTATISVGNLLSNSANLTFVGNVAIPITTPANSTALTVRAGSLLCDNNYLYVATANNLVKRVGTLQSF